MRELERYGGLVKMMNPAFHNARQEGVLRHGRSVVVVVVVVVVVAAVGGGIFAGVVVAVLLLEIHVLYTRRESRSSQSEARCNRRSLLISSA